MNKSVQDAVIATLKEMGLRPAPGTLPCTFALSEGRLVAQKFFYEGGYAVWVAARGTVSFYDEDGGLLIEKNAIVVYDDGGKLLKTVSLEISGREKAA
jgi:hypothetical protein